MENNNFVYQLMQYFPKAEEHRVAFSLYDGVAVTDITYQQLQVDILKATGFFRQRNLTGQHIAVLAPNSYNWVIVFFGIIASGNVAVLVNPNLPSEELYQHIQNADVTILCGNQADEKEYLGDRALQWIPFDLVMAGNAISLEEIVQVDLEETIVLMATSGTTGKSKIVEMTTKNISAMVENMSTVNAKYEKILLTAPEIIWMPLWNPI